MLVDGDHSRRKAHDMPPLRPGARRHGRSQLKRLVESIPEIKNAILTSGGGVVTAWPLKPVIRIIGLAATTPEVLDLLGYVPELIASDRLEISIIRMRRGQLLTTSVSGQLSLKIFLPLTTTIDDRHLSHIYNVVKKIRAIPNLH